MSEPVARPSPGAHRCEKSHGSSAPPFNRIETRDTMSTTTNIAAAGAGMAAVRAQENQRAAAEANPAEAKRVDEDPVADGRDVQQRGGFLG